MRTVLASSAIAASLLVASACGGPETAIGSGQDVSDLAVGVGCRGFTAEAKADLEMFVTGSGDCRLKGKKVTLHYFNKQNSREQWVSAATALSDLNGIKHLLVGDYFVVLGDVASLELAKRRVGGDITTP